jgi:hypothetical protein
MVGSLFAIYIASRSGVAANYVMEYPPPQFRAMIQNLGAEKTASLLTYLGAEQSRAFIHTWGRLQILLGPGLLVLLMLSRRANRLAMGLCGTMIVFAAFSAFVLRPEVDYLERALHFAAGSSGDHASYAMLHATFTALELLKMAAGLLLTGYLLLYRRAHRLRSVIGEPDVERPASEMSA